MSTTGITAADSRAAAAQPRRRWHWRRDWQLWVLLAPAIVFTAVFAYVPMYGIQLAFREFDFSKGLTGGKWVGLKYLAQFLATPNFWPMIRNTILIAGTTVLVGFIAPVLLALLINQIAHARAKRLTQTITYLPQFISVVVVVGMLQVFLSPSTGLITKIATGLGMENVNFLGSAAAFVPVYVISDVWQHCGWNSIIYLAALSGVDPQLYEAAKIDGASRWRTIFHVDIPALIPTMTVLFILNMGGVLNTGFDKIFLMQNTLNLSISEVIATYVYKIGIVSNQFSYSTAIGLFSTLINFGFLAVTNALAKKFANISLW
ncbi:MAG: ABC transporter permease subunit [Propionibacteriaceae bacterium]|jgi:putative aldouronate transport system permease protein|nr:ABC transporter permease subunit [Propionibacteriaceae bacterium]